MNEIRVYTSKSGHDYAAHGEIRLNSAYDPKTEARRFLQKKLPEKPGTLVLSGCTLGYMVEYVRETYPENKVLCFYYHPDFYHYCRGKFDLSQAPHYLVQSDGGNKLENFLSDHLEETDMEGLVLIEWQPAARQFTAESALLRQKISQRIRELNGSIMATRSFGRRWIRNAFHNFRDLRYPVTPVSRTDMVLVTGSGPSLRDSLDFIVKYRKRFFLLALSSSMTTLRSAGLTPDALIATDSGFWASTLFRDSASFDVPLFVPLSAAVPSPLAAASPLVILNQGLFHEQELLKDSPLESPVIPSGGTVAATALRLGEVLAEKALFTAGLDFCYRDVLLHARPHAFDILDEMVCNRTNPLLTRLWSRTVETAGEVLPGGSRRSLPFKTYAGWFARRKGHADVPSYRLNPTEVDVPGLVSLGADRAAEIIGNATGGEGGHTVRFERLDFDRQRRFAKARRLLNEWLAAVEGLPSGNSEGSTRVFQDSTVHELLHTLCIEDMLELNRLQRAGEHEKIPPTLERMKTSTKAFLKELRDGYESG